MYANQIKLLKNVMNLELCFLTAASCPKKDFYTPPPHTQMGQYNCLNVNLYSNEKQW